MMSFSKRLSTMPWYMWGNSIVIVIGIAYLLRFDLPDWVSLMSLFIACISWAGLCMDIRSLSR